MITLETVRHRAEADAQTHGYYLNPDAQFLQSLLEGLKLNEERYGYPSCPCRLASGNFEYDRDVICPCDYRDADVQQFGMCYCGLFVRKDVYEGKAQLQSIPERRPPEKQVRAYAASASNVEKPYASSVEKKLWYCRQCGYVVFRDEPPLVCPICKARREFFAKIEPRITLVE